ncbi:MAG: NAD(P)-dependent alcohol dehydrogenase [Pseudomonadota bacterium]
MAHSWILTPGQGIDSLRLQEHDSAAPGPLEIRIEIRAVSLNARDLMIAQGLSPMPALEHLIPLSDGAGEVVEIGDDVSRVSVGDRVVIAFNPAHQTGDYQPWMEPSALGAATQGLLRETVTLNEMAVVPLPESISYEQAACLPCAGVVAWNAIFESGPFFPGMTVLATGTGNVSAAAVQLAKSAGARVGITSSSDDKIQESIRLGADFGVNYRSRDDWDQLVLEQTGGRGADVILENAGPPSVATSIKAAAPQGRVMQIGLKALDGPAINVLDMALGSISLLPVMVGSRSMLERLVAAVDVNRIEFPIHDVIEFDQAPAAFFAARGGQTSGKIVISYVT